MEQQFINFVKIFEKLQRQDEREKKSNSKLTKFCHGGKPAPRSKGIESERKPSRSERTKRGDDYENIGPETPSSSHFRSPSSGNSPTENRQPGVESGSEDGGVEAGRRQDHKAWEAAERREREAAERVRDSTPQTSGEQQRNSEHNSPDRLSTQHENHTNQVNQTTRPALRVNTNTSGAKLQQSSPATARPQVSSSHSQHSSPAPSQKSQSPIHKTSPVSMHTDANMPGPSAHHVSPENDNSHPSSPHSPYNSHSSKSDGFADNKEPAPPHVHSQKPRSQHSSPIDSTYQGSEIHSEASYEVWEAGSGEGEEDHEEYWANPVTGSIQHGGH